MRSTVWLVAAALLVALVGCGRNLEKAVVGTWKMELDTSGMAAGKDKDQADMQKGITSQFSLDLKEDKSAVIKVMGMEQSGTWSLEGDKITITQGPASPLMGTVNSRGDRVTLAPPPGQEPMLKGAKFELVKQSGN